MVPASSWTPAHFHNYFFRLGFRVGDGVGARWWWWEVKGLQKAWTILAVMLGRESSLLQCIGLEFEDCEQGDSLGNEKGDGGLGLG